MEHIGFYRHMGLYKNLEWTERLREFQMHALLANDEHHPFDYLFTFIWPLHIERYCVVQPNNENHSSSFILLRLVFAKTRTHSNIRSQRPRILVAFSHLLFLLLLNLFFFRFTFSFSVDPCGKLDYTPIHFCL